ncbi:hypothetical protein JTE90_029128 [Oedothorax gibbosus]|uniref:Uncharacterized protein n=1 Tax=Oedothorax gibbosus TaxID=931172 RepID=A0AAV6TJZ6_9ARAC|nr:hypothetical protein JTE90_029128 [Oedothorax gibbosus]
MLSQVRINTEKSRYELLPFCSTRGFLPPSLSSPWEHSSLPFDRCTAPAKHPPESVPRSGSARYKDAARLGLEA